MCGKQISRRTFLGRGLGAAFAAGFVPGGLRISDLAPLLERDRPHLEMALAAWRWIETSRITTDAGITWPADPLDPDSVGDTLYTHGTGVVPFVLELFHATEDEHYLDAARRAADHLIARMDEISGAGLYVGVGGVAYVLSETWAASGDTRYLDATERATHRIIDDAVRTAGGVAWPQPRPDGAIEVHDIVSGAAGTALTLLFLRDRHGWEGALDTAVSCGQHLVESGHEQILGTTWEMSPNFPREMPNFSHGTAGIAYALARLGEAAERPDFTEAAVAGARYLQSIADIDSDGGYLIRHHTPGGEDLHYLSWCHGPVGTNRLFHALHESTGSGEWLEWFRMGARGIVAQGVPEQRTDGFWENVSRCGGSAGLGEFYLALERITGVTVYREFVERLNADLLGRKTDEGDGTKWTQAEHRVRPDLLVAQTGFMQGAAGIGKYFLHMDAMEERGEGPRLVLPDSHY